MLPTWMLLTCLPMPKYTYLFFLSKNGHSRPLFRYFRIFITVDSKQILDLIDCRWLDSNCGPLVLEATALSTEPQPLPWVHMFGFFKWANPASFSFIFGLFKQTIQFFKTNQCENVMSIQYMAPGFEPMTFITWVSSITTRPGLPPSHIWLLGRCSTIKSGLQL